MRGRIALCAAMIALAGLAAAAEAKAMSVAVKETQVRAKPSYVGKVLGTLAYGDAVQVSESRDGWAKVSATGKKLEGWINESALTAKKIALKSGSSSASQKASSGEAALAAKGFSEQIESENRKDSSYDYDAVDAMERATVSQEAVADFLEAGFLSGGEE